MVGKGSEVNRNEGLHSVLRGEAQQAGASDEGIQQECGDVGGVAVDGVAQRGLDITSACEEYLRLCTQRTILYVHPPRCDKIMMQWIRSFKF